MSAASASARKALAPILPFLGPIKDLLLDPRASPRSWSTPRSRTLLRAQGGAWTRCPAPVWTERELERAIVQIARSLDADIGLAEPLLDARLPDGSRVAAALPTDLGGPRADHPQAPREGLHGRGLGGVGHAAGGGARDGAARARGEGQHSWWPARPARARRRCSAPC